jgi:hypothetical protein
MESMPTNRAQSSGVGLFELRKTDPTPLYRGITKLKFQLDAPSFCRASTRNLYLRENCHVPGARIDSGKVTGSLAWEGNLILSILSCSSNCISTSWSYKFS